MLAHDPILYTGPLKENAIRVWAQDLLKGSTETTIGEWEADSKHHNILPAIFTELEPTLEKAGVTII